MTSEEKRNETKTNYKRKKDKGKETLFSQN
jgi:hypothetical protein